MPIDDFESRMAQLDDTFKNAPSDGGGFFNELPEPGTYQAILRAVDFFEQKNPPNCAFLKIIYEVVFDPKYNGAEVEMVYNLEPQKVSRPEEVQMKLGFLKSDLKKLGVDVDSDDFSLTMVRPGGDIWDQVFDVPVELAIKDSKKLNEQTGRPYRNAYLNTRTGDPLPKGAAGMATAMSDLPVQPIEDTPPPAEPDADEKIPFLWRPVEGRGRETRHNPFD